mgnify:CR=1 FL=1
MSSMQHRRIAALTWTERCALVFLCRWLVFLVCCVKQRACALCAHTAWQESPTVAWACHMRHKQEPISIQYCRNFVWTAAHGMCLQDISYIGQTGSAPLTRTSVVRTFGSQCRTRTFLGCPQHVSLWDMQRYRCMCRCSSVATEHGAEPQQGYGVLAACRSCAVSDALCWSVCHGVLLQGSGMICSGAVCTAALLMSSEVESAAAGGAAVTALVSNAICHLGTCHRAAGLQ